jgi:hypothetical protein
MKRFRVKFINEEAIMQSATVPGNVDTQEETTEDIAQDTDLVANATPTLQEQDVDGLEDKDVMNYVYFNAPQDIDDGTRQALFNRADQIRQKQMSGSTTPQDQEEFAKGVIAAASQTKDKATLGEAYSSGRVDGGDEYDFSGAISAHYDDRKTLEEFCLELAWELEADLENQFGLSGKEVWNVIEQWIEQNKEWVRERFGLHDEVTESDVIRARKMMLPILSKKFGK